MWGRLSPHPAFERADGARAACVPRAWRRSRSFCAKMRDWLLPAPQHGSADEDSLSHPAREVLAALVSAGRRSFPIWRAPPARLASEVEDGLWELVAAGLVTADGFENLRALIDPKRRARRRPGPQRASAARAGTMGAAAARPRTAAIRTRRSLREASCCCAGAWCSAICWRAKRWRRLARFAGRAAPHGSARRNSRRPIRLRFRRRAVRAPEAVDLLRGLRRSEESMEALTVATADPLNLAGIILPGARVSALAGGTVELVGTSELVAAG